MHHTSTDPADARNLLRAVCAAQAPRHAQHTATLSERLSVRLTACPRVLQVYQLQTAMAKTVIPAPERAARGAVANRLNNRAIQPLNERSVLGAF